MPIERASAPRKRTPRDPILLAIDQGSGSSRVLAFDRRGRLLAQASRPLPVQTPRPGWVEHRPQDLLGGVTSATIEVLGTLGRDPLGVGLSTQRSTLLLWERDTGRPLSPAISWQDRRAVDVCAELARHAGLIRRTTGLVLSPHYAAPKLRWLLDHIRGAQRRAERGDLLCGTVNTFLLWHLSGGRLYATDHTHAARMLLLNLATLQWDPRLCDLFGIPAGLLPEVRATVADWGEIQAGRRWLPVGASIGDQQAAAFGQGGSVPGDLCLQYGSGGFALLYTGPRPVRSPRLLTSIAWSMGERRAYLLEGTVNAVGSGLAWLQRNWRLPRDLSTLDLAASRSAATAPFLPALAGLGAPYWRPDAEAAITGLTLASQPADVVKGFLEGTAFLVSRIVDSLPGRPRIRRITASGGLADLATLLQAQADFLGRPVLRARLRETSGWGAAALCGVGLGVWRGPEAVDAIGYDREFRPADARSSVEERKKRWERLVRAALHVGR